MEPYRYTINLFFVCAWVDEYKLSKSCRYIKTCRENNLRTLVHVAKTIYALLAHMSRKQFTHFVRKVFARKSLPTGKLRLFRSLQWPISGYHQLVHNQKCQEIVKKGKKPGCQLLPRCWWPHQAHNHLWDKYDYHSDHCYGENLDDDDDDVCYDVFNNMCVICVWWCVRWCV